MVNYPVTKPDTDHAREEYSMVNFKKGADQALYTLAVQNERYFREACWAYRQHDAQGFVVPMQIWITNLGQILARIEENGPEIDQCSTAINYLCDTVLEDRRLSGRLFLLNKMGNVQKHQLNGESKPDPTDIDKIVSAYNSMLEAVSRQYPLPSVLAFCIMNTDSAAAQPKTNDTAKVIPPADSTRAAIGAGKQTGSVRQSSPPGIEGTGKERSASRLANQNQYQQYPYEQPLQLGEGTPAGTAHDPVNAASGRAKPRTTTGSSAAKTGSGTGTTAKASAGKSTAASAAAKTTAENAAGTGGAKKTAKSAKTAGTQTKTAEKIYEADSQSKWQHFSEQYMPYILGALGLFLLVCLILDRIKPADTPEQHLMGWVGYHLCHFLFGLVGGAAFLLPVVNFMMAYSWRRYSRSRMVGLQILLSFLFVTLLAGFIHVCKCVGDTGIAELVNFKELYRKGELFKTGGVIGGYLGWLLFHGLKFAGSLVLVIVVMPLLAMFIVGVTPSYVFSLLKEKFGQWKEARRERLAQRAAEEQARLEAEEAEAKRQAALAAEAAKNAPKQPPKPKTDDVFAGHADRTRDGGDTGTGKGKTARTSREKEQALGDPFAGTDTGAGQYGDAKSAKPARTAKGNTDRVLPPLYTEPDPTDTLSLDDLMNDDDIENDDDVSTRLAPRTEKADLGFELPDVIQLPAPSAPAAADSRSDVKAVGGHPGSSGNPLGISEADLGGEDPLKDVPMLSGTPKVEQPAARASEPIVRMVKTDLSELGSTAEDDDAQGADAEPDAIANAAKDEEEHPYVFPPIDLLTPGSATYEADTAEITKNTRILRDTLESFRIGVQEITCSCGPTVTRFEVKPDTGVRVRAITNLVDDIALSLAKSGVRIEAPIPGKSAVGIEVPNDKPATVYLRNLLETPEFQNHKSKLAACLGAEVSGMPIIFDINKMPHLLVSGTTGSGKSVCINCMILSILYKAAPQDVQLILIDPKKVEFNMYRNIPHLKTPIVTNPKKAAGALYAAVEEMEWRFNLIEQVGVRDIAGYNRMTAGDPEHPHMPQLVIIIDELADLMMTAPTDVENAICRLAQKGRAAGIHLILGTQRPSVDVITGLIKANIPSRIAFTVKSQVDSRTIIDVVGAEKLIGRGDMLYAPVGSVKPLRVQGAFVSDSEVESVVDFIKEHNDPPEFSEEFADQIDMEAARCGSGKKKSDDSFGSDSDDAGGDGDEDAKFWEALEVAVNADKVSTSLLQRRANIGYGRAAKIIDRMEDLGFVGPADGNKPRKLLITPQEFAELKMNGFKR